MKLLERMFTDPLAQQIGAGGAVAVLMVAAVMKFLPAFMTAFRATKGNGHALSPEAYELMLSRVFRTAMEPLVDKLGEINENVTYSRQNLDNHIRAVEMLLIDRLQRDENERIARGR